MEHIAFARFVTVDKAAAMTGLTPKAIRRKIENGVWLEHHQWERGPDGRIYIDIMGYTKWVKPWQ
nr:excisionase [Caldimonas tepidiphila]